MENCQNFVWSKFPTQWVFSEGNIYPGKTANRPKYLNLASRIIGLSPDIEISARLFSSAKYQHSQNRQNRCVNAYKQQNTRAHLETYEQLSLKMSHELKFLAYYDDNSLR